MAGKMPFEVLSARVYGVYVKSVWQLLGDLRVSMRGWEGRFLIGVARELEAFNGIMGIVNGPLGFRVCGKVFWNYKCRGIRLE